MSSLDKRLASIEGELGRMKDMPLLVLLGFGKDHEKWREPVERARQDNTPIKIISFGCLLAAKSVEEAEKLIEIHKAGPESHMSLRVIKDGNPDLTLADWPGILPDFLDDD